MSTIAEPFKALGAGNGFTFCRSAPPTDESEKPISVLTLKDSMAWYWLLKDFSLTATLYRAPVENQDRVDPGYSGSVTINFQDMFSETHPGEIANPLGEIYSKPPKDRAVLNTAQRSEFSSGNEVEDIPVQGSMVGNAYSNNGTFGSFTTTGNIPVFNAAPDITAELFITWFTDGSCRIVFYITHVYHKFVLTNLPTTASTVFGNSTPVNLGAVSTPYGTLTGYDITNNTNAAGAFFTHFVTGFTFTSSFFTFS